MEVQNFVIGRWTSASGDNRIDVTSPAFGDVHAQGSHGVEFYTQTTVVVERWPDEWCPTF